MEKLIELLNEYEKENKSDLYYKFELENGELFCYDDVSDVQWTMQDEAMVIISKKFGFIKWLVENEKIDFEKFYGKKDILNGLMHTMGVPMEERLIIMLAIQDNPIEFLISILK